MVKWLGRWAPLVGSSLLALSVLLPLVGLPELGALLGNVAATPGVGDASPVPQGEITAAITQGVAAVLVVIGVVRKVLAVYQEPSLKK